VRCQPKAGSMQQVRDGALENLVCVRHRRFERRCRWRGFGLCGSERGCLRGWGCDNGRRPWVGGTTNQQNTCQSTESGYSGRRYCRISLIHDVRDVRVFRAGLLPPGNHPDEPHVLAFVCL
jgi:hypothetical protein